MKTGLVLFLNGSSSAGKTSIGKALQERLDAPFMLLSVDDLFHMLPRRFLNPQNSEDGALFSKVAISLISGFPDMVASLANSGVDLIVDHVLQEEGWLDACLESWQGLNVLFIGVKCPLAILEEREKARGNRNIGTARYQFERVHRHGCYDLELDTSVLSVEDCVSRIMDLMQNRPAQTAFQKLTNARLPAQ